MKKTKKALALILAGLMTASMTAAAPVKLQKPHRLLQILLQKKTLPHWQELSRKTLAYRGLL